MTVTDWFIVAALLTVWLVLNRHRPTQDQPIDCPDFVEDL